jgi:hypothetical protein
VDSYESAPFLFALLPLGEQAHQRKPGFRCPFSPEFSPMVGLAISQLNLAEILPIVKD